MITKATNLVRILLEDLVSPGDIAVDATCGNGNDTLILSSLVGETGRVVSIDIQLEAMASARLTLSESVENVHFLHDCHSKLDTLLSGFPRPSVVVFNLGYLPGGDKSLVTKPHTTVKALRHALEAIKVGGHVVMVVYTGHPGGVEEGLAIDHFISSLDSKHYAVMKHQWLNLPGSPPYVLLFERRV